MSRYKIEEIQYTFKAQDGRIKEGRLSDLTEKKRVGQTNSIGQTVKGPAKGMLVIYRDEVLEDGTKEAVGLLKKSL